MVRAIQQRVFIRFCNADRGRLQMFLDPIGRDQDISVAIATLHYALTHVHLRLVKYGWAVMCIRPLVPIVVRLDYSVKTDYAYGTSNFSGGHVFSWGTQPHRSRCLPPKSTSGASSPTSMKIALRKVSTRTSFASFRRKRTSRTSCWSGA